MADIVLASEGQEKFYSLLTKAGQAQIANAVTMNKKVDFVTMKVGDGGGAYYDPDEDQTDLRNIVWEGTISEVSIDNDNPNWINIKAIIPTTDGGFTVREYGVYDAENNLLAIAKCAETYKPVVSDGSTKELMLNMVLAVVNTDAVELKIDPTVIIATKHDITELRTEMIEMMISGVKFVRPTGMGNAITIAEMDLTKIYDGYNRTFIAKYDNDPSLTTTINGKNLYKPNTTDSPTIKAGKAYTYWYDIANDCFFIKASAEGDAIPSNVLANKSFSNSNDTGLKGTMPNNGTLNKTLNAGESYTIPLGYTDGGTVKVNSLASQTGGTATPNRILSPYTAYVNGNKITGTIPTLGTATYTPSTTDQVISAGSYLGGNITIKGDPNFKPENIASGKTMFGVTGTGGGGFYPLSNAGTGGSGYPCCRFQYSKQIMIYMYYGDYGRNTHYVDVLVNDVTTFTRGKPYYATLAYRIMENSDGTHEFQFYVPQDGWGIRILGCTDYNGYQVGTSISKGSFNTFGKNYTRPFGDLTFFNTGATVLKEGAFVYSE